MDRVPTTRPSSLAHSVVVVGSAWYGVTRRPEGHTQTGRVGTHEAAGNVGVVQQRKAGFQFGLGRGDLQDQPAWVHGLDVHHAPVDAEPQVLGQGGQSPARQLSPLPAGLLPER